jgi:hypothetical protein
MVRSIKLSLLMAILVCLWAFQAGAVETLILKTQKDQVNYAIGINIVSNLKQQGIEVDLDLVIQGMKDVHSGEKLLMTDEEVRKAIYLYQTEVRKNYEKARTKTNEGKKKKTENVPVGGKE